MLSTVERRFLSLSAEKMTLFVAALLFKNPKNVEPQIYIFKNFIVTSDSSFLLQRSISHCRSDKCRFCFKQQISKSNKLNFQKLLKLQKLRLALPYEILRRQRKVH